MKNQGSKTSFSSPENSKAQFLLIQDRINYLRDNTDFASVLFESLIGYAIIAADFDGNIIAYNEGAHQIYGYAPGEIIGKQSIEIFFPKDFIEVGKLDHITEELIGKERFSYEGEKVRKDGSRFPAQILLTLTKGKNSKVVGFIEIVQDLTESKRAEEVLQSSEANLRKVIEKNVDSLIIVDRNGVVCFTNPAAEALFGRKAEELIGELFGFPVTAGGTTEIEIIRRGGETRVAEMQVVEIHWEKKDAYLASVRDITERKQAEKAKVEAQQQELQMKDDFISNISHELRTPLTSIKEGLSQILEGLLGETTEGQREFLSMCLEDIDRLARIINSLLNISRIESGKVELKKELLDISALCRNIIVSFSSQSKNKGLEFKGIIPKDKLEIYADKDKMVEVFTNLVGNALKFTDKGHIHLLVEEKEGMVECSVSDTGCGIAKEDLPKLYGRFQQFGRVYGPGEKGTGLGLSIVKNIIELHHSEIRVESELNKGTKFTFRLPKYTPRELFREYVVNGIKEAVHRKESLSILVLYIENFAVVKEKIEDNRIAAIMNKLHEVIGSSLRRKGDISFKNTRAILTILPVTKREQADIIARRLEQTIGNYMSEEKLDRVIKIGCKTAGFPEDGSNADELFDKIRVAIG